MAEFQEVMRQWVRARKATASSAEENVLLLSVHTVEKFDGEEHKPSNKPSALYSEARLNQIR